MKKTGLKTTALSLILCVSLCSCATATYVEDDGAATTEATTTEIVSDAETTTAGEAASADATEATEEAGDAEESTTETSKSDWRETTPYECLSLDGVEENHIITDDYCYIESDKYVLFLDKDVDLPGDFVVNLDAIIDEIEVQTGLSACPDTYNTGFPDMSVYFDEYPWEDVDIGRKIPIFIMVDREDEGLISCACESFAVFVIYELYSDEFWMSHFSRDEDWRLVDYIDYTTISHELTHVVTERRGKMTNIMTEGFAEFMGLSIVSTLADQYPSIGETNAKRYLYDNAIPAPVNADNAEAVFISDYNDISHADRGAEYVTGRYFSKFLYEKFGDGFIADYFNTLDKYNYPDIYGDYDETVVTGYVEALKETYGDDVFTEFGDWCVANNALQSIEGVW